MKGCPWTEPLSDTSSSVLQPLWDHTILSEHKETEAPLWLEPHGFVVTDTGLWLESVRPNPLLSAREQSEPLGHRSLRNHGT